MAEKTPTITYKKSRSNRRALKFWDTADMFDSMQEATNIRYVIEKVAEERDIHPQDIGNIAISADVLYALADCFCQAYKLLLNEELIKSGNISKIQPTLN